MKTFNKIMKVLMPVTAVILLNACGGGGGGGGGTAPLATGGFVKYVGDSSTLAGIGLIDTGPTTRWQHMYTPADVEGSGYIQSISLIAVDARASDITCPDLSIKMGHTSLAELTNTFADNVENGKGSLISVRSAAEVVFTAGEAGDMYTIALDEPFMYNGADNLVVEFERVAACSGSFTEGGTYVTPVSATWTRTDGSPTGNTGIFFTDLVFDFSGGVNLQEAAPDTTNQFPFTTALKRTQHLYTAADVNGSGPITGIGFQLGVASVEAEYNATVKIGHTTLDQFSVTSDFADNYSATPTVMAENVTFTIPAGLGVGDWFWLPLSGSFKYNGTDNLIVDVDVTAATATNEIRVENDTLNVRAYGEEGSTTPYAVNTNKYSVMFRFNGATMDVHSLASQSASSQVLGDDANGGQIQSLYKVTDLGTSGKITAVYVRMAADSSAATVTNHKIYLGHTAKASLNVGDTYTDNMDGYVLAYSGSTVVPDTLKAGDWLKLPLTTPFNYDGSSNLTVLFTGETDVTNSVRGSLDSTRFSTASVGRNDNSVGIDGQPSWDWNGIVDIKLELVK